MGIWAASLRAPRHTENTDAPPLAASAATSRYDTELCRTAGLAAWEGYAARPSRSSALDGDSSARLQSGQIRSHLSCCRGLRHMVWRITKQISSLKAGWLAALLGGVLVGTVLLGSSNAPQATAVPDGSASGELTDTGDQIWHQDSPGILGDAEADDSFGGALASGDFDGDGVEDLAVSVPGEIIVSAVGAGAVSILYGSDSGLTNTGDQLWHQDSAGD